MDASHQQKQVPIIPEFYSEATEIPFKSQQAGRPVYEDREFVRIIIPGSRGTTAVQAVSDVERERWPEQYAAFKKGLEPVLEGTPLEKWPPIKASQVKEFAHFNVRTVEHLAGLNDAQLQAMPMGTRELHRAAKVFLEAAEKGTGPLMALVRDNETMKADNAALKDQVRDLARQVEQLISEKANARA